MKKRTLLITAALLAFGLHLGCDFSGGKKEQKGGSAKVQDKMHLPDKNNIVLDEETGLQVEKDVITVTFSRFTDESEVKAIIQEIGGEIVGFQGDSNFFQIRLPGADLEKSKEICLKLLSGHKEVEYAVPNTVSRADNPYWDESRNK